jgi:MFS family permease
MSRVRQIALFLGLRQSIVGLLAMVILLDMGERMAERFLPIYLMALGGGAISVGLLNGLDNLLSALYSFPGGYLSDRLGVKRALLLFNLMAFAGFLVVILIPSWQAVIAGAVLFISWTAISQPASMGLIARSLPAQKRTMGVSMHSLVRRIPMALGPVVGGAFIDHWGERQGVRYAFVAAAVLGLVAMIAQQRLIEDDRGRRAEARSAPERNPLRLLKRMGPELRFLLTSDILIRFCEQIPYAFVVIWAMKTIAHPVGPVQFGLLTSIEQATAILVYVPIATLADRTTKRPFIIITFVFFTLFPLALLFSRSFVALVYAFILRGLKEFGEPARKALIVDLCPEDQKAGMFGAYYLARDTVVSLAAFGGAFLWLISPATNLLTAFAFGAIGTIWFALKGKNPTTAQGVTVQSS